MRIDLHVHTYASGDSTTLPAELAERMGPNDVVAITDHHSLDGALELARLRPGQVIVGEEIDSGEGELIGLFLTDPVPRRGGLLQTARRIRALGGLVLAPHPTDPARRGVGTAGLVALAEEGLLDLVEVANAKRRSLDEESRAVARSLGLVVVATSDAHVPEALFAAGMVVDAEAGAHAARGPAGLRGALAAGRLYHAYADPPRAWPRPVVPGS